MQLSDDHKTSLCWSSSFADCFSCAHGSISILYHQTGLAWIERGDWRSCQLIGVQNNPFRSICPKGLFSVLPTYLNLLRHKIWHFLLSTTLPITYLCFFLEDQAHNYNIIILILIRILLWSMIRKRWPLSILRTVRSTEGAVPVSSRDMYLESSRRELPLLLFLSSLCWQHNTQHHSLWYANCQHFLSSCVALMEWWLLVEK